MVTRSEPEIPERIREELDRQDRNVSWLARKAGISPSYAGRMLKGERPLTDEFRASVAESLGVPADELFAEVPA